MTTVRLDQLNSMTHPALCAWYRALGYIGGLHPLETWRKDELVASILELEARRARTGCDQCKRPGEFCGLSFIADDRMPCVCCGDPTMVRSLCGAARTGVCTGTPWETPPFEAEPARRPRPAVRPAPATRAPRRSDEQADEYDAAIRRLTAGEPLRLLAALEGPFAPLRTIPGETRKSRPFWRPQLPPITFTARVTTGYRWQRPYSGRVAVLDRSGAWVAAMSSALVAHGALEHTGECGFSNRPGYYLINAYEWHEADRMPSPLGTAKPGTTVWVPAPRVQLLGQLVDQGRWPDVDVLDSWTGDGVRLTDFTDYINAIRSYAITTWGRQSPQYEEVKTSIGEVTSMLLGSIDGVRRVWKGLAARPDYTHTWQEQGSSTLWRWGDEARQVVPELAPVALRNIDELVVPVDAVELLAGRRRPGGKKPMVLDPSGIALGSFKIKDIEEWVA